MGVDQASGHIRKPLSQVDERHASGASLLGKVGDHSAIVQQFFRGRSASSPRTNFPTPTAGFGTHEPSGYAPHQPCEVIVPTTRVYAVTSGHRLIFSLHTPMITGGPHPSASWLCSCRRAAFRQQFGRQCSRRRFTTSGSTSVVTEEKPSAACPEPRAKALATGVDGSRCRAVAGRRRVPPVLVDIEIRAWQAPPAVVNNCCRESSIKPATPPSTSPTSAWPSRRRPSQRSGTRVRSCWVSTRPTRYRSSARSWWGL
jgi:hypothetical protein